MGGVSGQLGRHVGCTNELKKREGAKSEVWGTGGQAKRNSRWGGEVECHLHVTWVSRIHYVLPATPKSAARGRESSVLVAAWRGKSLGEEGRGGEGRGGEEGGTTFGPGVLETLRGGFSTRNRILISVSEWGIHSRTLVSLKVG
jgi:hypothetical protein